MASSRRGAPVPSRGLLRSCPERSHATRPRAPAAVPAGPSSPWLVLAAVLLASVAAVMAQFAAPPLMPLLMDAFGIDLAQASSLMSVFSITGLVLALPAGLILGRFGADRDRGSRPWPRWSPAA